MAAQARLSIRACRTYRRDGSHMNAVGARQRDRRLRGGNNSSVDSVVRFAGRPERPDSACYRFAVFHFFGDRRISSRGDPRFRRNSTPLPRLFPRDVLSYCFYTEIGFPQWRETRPRAREKERERDVAWLKYTKIARKVMIARRYARGRNVRPDGEINKRE